MQLLCRGRSRMLTVGSTENPLKCVRVSLEGDEGHCVWLFVDVDSLEDTRWWEVFPLWAVSVLVSGSASSGESHSHTHRREAIHLWLLWAVFPTETAATSSHQPLSRPRLRAASTTREGLSVKFGIQYSLFGTRRWHCLVWLPCISSHCIYRSLLFLKTSAIFLLWILGHRYKLFKSRSTNSIRYIFFTERVVHFWNSLPPTTVNFSSLSIHLFVRTFVYTYIYTRIHQHFLQWFDTVGWVTWRASAL